MFVADQLIKHVTFIITFSAQFPPCYPQVISFSKRNTAKSDEWCCRFIVVCLSRSYCATRVTNILTLCAINYLSLVIKCLRRKIPTVWWHGSQDDKRYCGKLFKTIIGRMLFLQRVWRKEYANKLFKLFKIAIVEPEV